MSKVSRGAHITLIVERPVRPFLKWVGGKTQLLDQFRPMLPEMFGRYFESFVRGAGCQQSLVTSFAELTKKGVYPMLSNSGTPAGARSLCGLPNRGGLRRPRVNSKAERRGKVSEVVIRNYGARPGAKRRFA